MAVRPRAAAENATRRNSVRFQVPLLGVVTLPPADELAFIGAVGALAALGAIEWPIAAAIGAGHVLVSNRRSKALRDFGEALETL
jgi:hypothetical protein